MLAELHCQDMFCKYCIYQQDGGVGQSLLPNIALTLEWIRLAERIPVRVHLDKVPEGIDLRVGMTASVLIMTGTDAGQSMDLKPVAALKLLQ